MANLADSMRELAESLGLEEADVVTLSTVVEQGEKAVLEAKPGEEQKALRQAGFSPNPELVKVIKQANTPDS